jgi:tetratricopeptide (TPR) repeat protein
VAGDLTARELLDRGATRLVENGANYEPLLRAALLRSIGNSYRSMVLPEKAEPLLRESLAIYREHPESEPVELAESLLAYGWYLHDRFEPDEALAYYREAYELLRANLGEEDDQTVRCKFHIGWLLADMGDVDESERLLREVIATLKRPGHQRRDLAVAELGLVSVLIDNFREVEALPWLIDANRTMGSEGRGDSFFQALRAFQAGYTFRQLNLLGRSEQELQRSLVIATDVVGDQHPYVAFILHESAMTKLAMGKAIEAEESFRRAYRIVERNRYLGHPRAHKLVIMLSNLLLEQGNRREAADLFDVMLDARRRRYPKKAEWIADGLVQRAWSRPGLTPVQVEAETDEALKLYAAAPGSHINFLPEALQLKIRSLMGRGDYARAEELAGKLLALDLSRYPQLDQNQLRAWAWTHRGVCFARLGRYEEAEGDLGRATRVLRGPDLALPLEGSIVMELQRGDPAAAAALARRWRELPPRHAQDAYSLAASLLRCANQAGDSELGRQCRAEAVEALGDAVARGYSDLAQFRRDFGPLGDLPEVRALELTLLDRAFPADAPFAQPEEPFASDRSYDLFGGATGGAIARLFQTAEGRWSLDYRDQALSLREVERTPYAITFEPEGKGSAYRVLSNGILLRAEKGRWVRLPLRMARWRCHGTDEPPR